MLSLMRVLALESSCDESAVAVLDEEAGLRAHELFSQVDLHRAYGGVVPELASRDHVRRLLPLIRTVLDKASIAPAEIQGVAYTAGPGLIGALLTGAALARSLAFAWGVPSIGVHHLEGHLLAPHTQNALERAQLPAFEAMRYGYRDVGLRHHAGMSVMASASAPLAADGTHRYL